ncbi:MAG: DUF2975 domain-containing protein [Ruminococcaceae bacterium]|nr:DUF2975 domain-containing protein [Oscillospiraceae bacterium]
MKKETMTKLLHAVLVVAVLLMAAIFFWAVPQFGLYMAEVEAPEFAYAYWPCLIWAWAFALPIFAAVVPAWRIFTSISAPGGAFTGANARDLRIIAYLAFVDAVIFPVGMVAVGSLGAGSPGLTVIVTPAVMFCCAAVGIAALCLGRLVDDAVRLREENDLTI